jgi:transposase
MSKPKPPTAKEFDKRFPDDDACLEHMMRVRYGERVHCQSPKCAGREARYYRIKGRRAYECERCAAQVYPTAGTPFHGSRTSLREWFRVMFMFIASRNGVSAKEIQRTIGVTYKTAWRMGHEIRKYMGYVDGDWPLGGPGAIVEIDKAFIGGVDPKGTEPDKKIVLGMVERGGDIVTRHITDRQQPTVLWPVNRYVKPGTTIMSDTAPVYAPLKDKYTLEQVNHARGEYVRGTTHTNSIESFWANLKRGINGTYIAVSSKHLQKYLWEFEFRHNMRRCPHLMLDTLLLAFPRPK